jgi:hypothetical protein
MAEADDERLVRQVVSAIADAVRAVSDPPGLTPRQ